MATQQPFKLRGRKLLNMDVHPKASSGVDQILACSLLAIEKEVQKPEMKPIWDHLLYKPSFKVRTFEFAKSCP